MFTVDLPLRQGETAGAAAGEADGPPDDAWAAGETADDNPDGARPEAGKENLV